MGQAAGRVSGEPTGRFAGGMCGRCTPARPPRPGRPRRRPGPQPSPGSWPLLIPVLKAGRVVVVETVVSIAPRQPVAVFDNHVLHFGCGVVKAPQPTDQEQLTVL